MDVSSVKFGMPGQGGVMNTQSHVIPTYNITRNPCSPDVGCSNASDKALRGSVSVISLKMTFYPKPCAAEKTSFAENKHHKTFALTLASERCSPATAADIESLTTRVFAPLVFFLM